PPRRDGAGALRRADPPHDRRNNDPRVARLAARGCFLDFSGEEPAAPAELEVNPDQTSAPSTLGGPLGVPASAGPVPPQGAPPTGQTRLDGTRVPEDSGPNPDQRVNCMMRADTRPVISADRDSGTKTHPRWPDRSAAHVFACCGANPG